MALSTKQLQGFFLFGGVAGVITTKLLAFISGLVSSIPGVNLDLQSISGTTTGLGGIINTDLAQKLFGFIPTQITLPDVFMSFIGGGLFVLLGAFLVTNVKMLQFAKTKAGKLATIFVTAGIGAGWILSMSIGVPTLAGIIAVSINAWILSWILLKTAEAIWPKIIPV